MANSNEFNTDLRRGDCWTLEVTWKPGNSDINLTGYTAEFAINWPRQIVGNSWVVAGKLTSDPVVNTSADTFSVYLDAAETLEIPSIGIAAYQLRATAPDGCKTTISTGRLSILEDYIDA